MQIKCRHKPQKKSYNSLCYTRKIKELNQKSGWFIFIYRESVSHSEKNNKSLVTVDFISAIGDPLIFYLKLPAIQLDYYSFFSAQTFADVYWLLRR